MPKKNKVANSRNIYIDQSSRSGTLKPISSGGASLQLPPGEPDLEPLRSVTREWLVPRLVEKFLRTHGVELRAFRTATQSMSTHDSTRKSNTARISKGDAD